MVNVRGLPIRFADSPVLFTESTSDWALALSVVGVEPVSGAAVGAVPESLPRQPEPTMPGTVSSRKYRNSFFKVDLDSGPARETYD